MDCDSGSNGIAKCQISGGDVTLYVWERTNKYTSYKGNDVNYTFTAYIFPAKYDNTPVATGTVTASFSNGIGTGAFTPKN
ncbi:MAG: hypothetical protein LBV17_01570 [Treponema sp.]|nr:hypothetical protein [Treponema sp.]